MYKQRICEVNFPNGIPQYLQSGETGLFMNVKKGEKEQSNVEFTCK